MKIWTEMICGVLIGFMAHYIGFKSGFSAGYWSGVQDIGKAMSDACKLLKKYPEGLQKGEGSDEQQVDS